MPRFAHDPTPLLDPPPCVQAEVDAAWERAQELFAGELELHFELGDAGPVCELRVPGGSALERLSAAEALALACGDAMLALAA